MKLKFRGLGEALAKLAFELITIIAGILIALFVNNIQEQKRDREVLQATLRSLSGEFAKNVENMNRIQRRLERFRDTLTFYQNRKELSLNDIAVKAPGLTTADLFTTNWQATLTNNSVRLLQFETVTLLSQIDAKHRELKDQSSILSSIVYSPALYKTGDEAMAYRRVIGDWLGSYLGNEQELIALYKQFDETIALYR